MTTIDIVTSIDQRIRAARDEIAKLESARHSLANGTKASPAKPRRARSKPEAPTHAVVLVGQLTALLGQSEGLSTSELSKATGGRSTQILPLLRELESAGDVRRSGERRGTRWHAITNEDKIAARAAEIVARTKAPKRLRKR
jgi:hypothetical protein